MSKKKKHYICKTCSRKIPKDAYHVTIDACMPDGSVGFFRVCEKCYKKGRHLSIADMMMQGQEIGRN